MFKIGDRVKINQKHIDDNIKAAIQGLEGIIVQFPDNYTGGFDYAIRIHRMVFGLNEDELELIKGNEHGFYE